MCVYVREGSGLGAGPLCKAAIHLGSARFNPLKFLPDPVPPRKTKNQFAAKEAQERRIVENLKPFVGNPAGNNPAGRAGPAAGSESCVVVGDRPCEA